MISRSEQSRVVHIPPVAQVATQEQSVAVARATVDDLTLLYPTELERYREQISLQGGVLPCLIHPFYCMVFKSEETSLSDAFKVLADPRANSDELASVAQDLYVLDYETERHNLKTLRGYAVKLSRLLALSPRVIAISEAIGPDEDIHDELNNTVAAIRNQGYKGNILYYLTRQANPYPAKMYKEGYREVFKALDNLNAPENERPLHLLLGGMNILFEAQSADDQAQKAPHEDGVLIATRSFRSQAGTQPEFEDKAYMAGGCVGYFYGAAQRYGKFDITISQVSFPEPYPMPLVPRVAPSAQGALR